MRKEITISYDDSDASKCSMSINGKSAPNVSYVKLQMRSITTEDEGKVIVSRSGELLISKFSGVKESGVLNSAT